MIPREQLLRIRRIASRANPRVKEWASLADRTERDRLGVTLAEGVRLVEEGLRATESGLFRPVALLVSDSGAERPEAGGLFELAGELGIERFNLADDCHAKVSDLKNADGLALVMEFSAGPTDPVALFSRADAKWLVAAGVQDPGNAGALARIALAAGADGCLFLDGTDPHSPKFLRGSMGAVFRLPCRSLSADAFAAAWPATGARLIAATADADAVDFRDVDYSPPLALLVGGERGLPETLLRLATGTARIPLRGGVESLNLAVAAGIIAFEAERKWR